MKTIKLTKGYEAIVDDEDYESLAAVKWRAFESKGTVYACRAHSTLMHRVLVPHAGETVDHINGNGLDNRRANLRAATFSENQRNKGKPRTRCPVSRFKGVALNRNCVSSWYAFYKLDKKKVRLGTFSTEIAAALAYDLAVRARDGKYARLNFPYGIG